MENTNQQLLAFLKENPGATKTAIGAALNIKGLPLFNLLRMHVRERVITESKEGEEISYMVAHAESNTADNQPAQSAEKEKEYAASSNEGALSQDGEQPSDAATVNTDAAETTGGKAEEVSENIQAGRDSSKYTFNNGQYGKGPLVLAVVTHYVKERRGLTYDKLKEVFPDTLLKRFGIFQDEQTAKVIAKGGRRYFTKPEQVIKLKDKSVVVCNQFTLANLQPFMNVVEELGYRIS